MNGLIGRPCNAECGAQQAHDVEWVVQVLGDTQTTLAAHRQIFRAIVVIIQLGIDEGDKLFSVVYSD